MNSKRLLYVMMPALVLLLTVSCSEIKKRLDKTTEQTEKEEKAVSPFVGTWRIQAEIPKHTITDEDGKATLELDLEGICTFEENGSESGKMDLEVEMKIPKLDKFTITFKDIVVKGTWRQEGDKIIENKSSIDFDIAEAEVETDQGERIKKEIYKYLMQNDDKFRKQIKHYLFTEDPSTILEQDQSHFILRNKDFNSGQLIKFVYTRKVESD